MLVVIAQLIIANNPSVKPIDVDASAINFLAGIGVPAPIIDPLTQVAFADWMSLPHHFIAPVNQLEALNTEELYRPWFDRRYLTVAGGLNGDPIALDLESLLMCFIFHDEMHPRENFLPDDFVLHTPHSYTDFWTGVANEPDFPVDAYDAEERWGRPPRANARG